MNNKSLKLLDEKKEYVIWDTKTFLKTKILTVKEKIDKFAYVRI